MTRPFTAADYELAGGDGGVDRAWYLGAYPDVAAAGIDPVRHFLEWGWREGRDPRADFSTSGYREAHPRADGNPLLHYLRSTFAVRSGETVASAWYLLWKQGVLHPKGGQELRLDSTLGTPGARKFLFTGHEASRTGAPLVLLRLMEALRSRTEAEFILILERGGPLLEEYQRVAHVLVNHGGVLYPRLPRLLDSIAAPRPELAFINSADSWRLIRPVRESGVKPVVSLVHERVVHYPADVWRSILEASDRVLFPAEAVKSAFCARYPEFSGAVAISQGLLDPEFGRGDRDAARLELRRRLGLPPDAPIVLACGTQCLRKGVDLFVQLAALVRARARKDAHFVWLGAKNDSDHFFSMLDLAVDLLGLRSSVTFLDAAADPEPYFLAADAFVLTSRDDPFPCVIHEAMACALPIVAFDGAGGAKEAFEGECGIIVPYLDLEAMALSLASIVDDPAGYAAMGERARARVGSAYRFSDYAERMWGILKGELDRKAERSPALPG